MRDKFKILGLAAALIAAGAGVLLFVSGPSLPDRSAGNDGPGAGTGGGELSRRAEAKLPRSSVRGNPSLEPTRAGGATFENLMQDAVFQRLGLRDRLVRMEDLLLQFAPEAREASLVLYSENFEMADTDLDQLLDRGNLTHAHRVLVSAWAIADGPAAFDYAARDGDADLIVAALHGWLQHEPDAAIGRVDELRDRRDFDYIAYKLPALLNAVHPGQGMDWASRLPSELRTNALRLGLIDWMNRDPEKAVGWYRRALHLDPDHVLLRDVVTSLRREDPETAHKWIEALPRADARTAALKMIE